MKPNKRILILTYNMIPYCDSWGSCQRMYYLAEEMQNKGHEVYVLSSKDSDISNNFDQKINFNQIFVNSILFKNNVSNAPNTVTTNHQAKPSLLQKLRKKTLTLIYKLEKSIFNEPTPQIGIKGLLWAIKTRKTILDLIRTKNISLVIISSPPFSILQTSVFLKKRLKDVTIGIDYRDPWNLWDGGTTISRYFEKKYLERADFITVTTDTLKTDLAKQFKIDKNKFDIIYNGYSEYLWNKLQPEKKDKKEKIVLSYVGNISFIKNSYRDFSEFFKAYDIIRSKNIFNLKFIGVSPSSELKELSLRYPEIEFIPKVSPLESCAFMLQSDVLMNLHTAKDNSSHYLIGGKIFDYLKSNKIILSINSKNSFEQVFLKNFNRTVLTTNEQSSILMAFEEIQKIYQNNKIEINDITEFSRENQNKKFTETISKFALMSEG